MKKCQFCDHLRAGHGGGFPSNRETAVEWGGKWEPACKPGSVGDSHSSGMHVAVHLKQPTRELVRAARRGQRPPAPLFGLAPGGVYPATDVATGAVRSYRTISPLPISRERLVGGIFSVALSVGSRPPGITWHPALRSPDFPPHRETRRLPGRLPPVFSPSRGQNHRTESFQADVSSAE